MGVIFGCFAEVASRFPAGGRTLSLRARGLRARHGHSNGMDAPARAGGRAGRERQFVCDLSWRILAACHGSSCPALSSSLFWLGVLAFINVRGVRAGTQVSNFFTAAKLLPLFAVIAMGLFVLAAHRGAISPAAPATLTTSQWLKAVLLLVFAYGGFETALAPMGEAKDARRDAPFALFAALVVCTVVYALIQWVVVGVLPDAAHSERPLADVARVAVGSFGAALVAVGALISFYGYLSAKILGMPRVTFALAEQGDFPQAFAAVHPRFHTPYVSILVFAALVWAFALSGEFKWNVTISAVARLLYYAVCCAALPVLRRKRVGDAGFRLPAGNFLAGIAVVMCAILVTRVDFGQSLIVLATIALGLLNWALVTRRRAAD